MTPSSFEPDTLRILNHHVSPTLFISHVSLSTLHRDASLDDTSDTNDLPRDTVAPHTPHRSHKHPSKQNAIHNPHIHQATALLSATVQSTRHPYSRIPTGPETRVPVRLKDLPLLRLRTHMHGYFLLRVRQRGGCRSGLPDQNMKTCVCGRVSCDGGLLRCSFVVVMGLNVECSEGCYLL